MKKLLSLFALLLLLPTSALAETECESDADCPEGSYCVMVPTAVPDCPPCDPDDGECPDCPEPQPGDAVGYCEEIDLGFDGIVAGECATDADCPLDFTCQEVEIPCYDMPTCACACEPCPEGDPDCEAKCDECDCPEPEPCTEETQMLCVYTPTECVEDGDCGEGFECREIEECSGGGSMGCACTECVCADCPEGEECPPCDCPEEPVCECDDVPEEFEEECTVLAAICFPKEVPCETDADCAEGFICFEDPEGETSVSSDCACPGCFCEEGDEECDCPPCECDEEPLPPEEYVAEMICIPEGWEDAEFLGGGGSAMGADFETNADGTPKGEQDVEEPVSPEPGDGDGTSGATEESADDGSSESSGCTAGGSANAASALLLALLGLALVTTRRKVFVRR